MTSAEIGILKLVWDMIHGLAGGYSGRKQSLFEHHVEPLQTKMVSVHTDYITGFQQIRCHLTDETQPPSDIIDFMKERRRVYDHERGIARDLATEMENARRAGINDGLWRDVNTYADSIVKYFSATATIGGFTWYTDFLQSVEASIRMGFGDVGETVWRDVGFSGSPRKDYLNGGQHSGPRPSTCI